MDAVKRVLYITYDGLTDPLGQSQVLPYLEQLSRQGYQFTILSFEKKERYQKERGIIEGITSAAGITWVPLTFTSNPPVLSKIWDRNRMWQTALRLYKENKYDLIHCRSYVAAEVGLRLKQRYRVKFLFDMRGFWADEKVDNGQWNLKNPLFRSVYRQYKQKERSFLLQADGIVSLTQAAKNFLLDQQGYEHLSIDVIPCCADLEHFNYGEVDPVKKEELKKQLQLSPGTRFVTYLGSVGGWYMTKEMFLFFKQLAQHDPSYKMLILTKDAPEKVKAEASSLGIKPESIIVTYADRKSLPLYLSLTTFSIFFIRNSFSKKASSPTKHAELMGMGVPVICNDIGDTGTIINETGTGFVLNDFSNKSFQEAILNLQNILALSKIQIRQCAIDRFDLNAGAEKYGHLYQRVLENKKAGHHVSC